MKDKARFVKISILSVILVSFAALATYKAIAGTNTSSSPCPPSGACPVRMNGPPQAESE